jgi:hypothetical protein
MSVGESQETSPSGTVAFTTNPAIRAIPRSRLRTLVTVATIRCRKRQGKKTPWCCVG